MAFQKGKSGNPVGGHGKAKIITQRIVSELNAKKCAKLHQFASALLDKAIKGDVAAMREVIDRVEGKAPQVIAGDPESPVAISIKVLLVDAPQR